MTGIKYMEYCLLYYQYSINYHEWELNDWVLFDIVMTICETGTLAKYSCEVKNHHCSLLKNSALIL